MYGPTYICLYYVAPARLEPQWSEWNCLFPAAPRRLLCRTQVVQYQLDHPVLTYSFCAETWTKYIRMLYCGPKVAPQRTTIIPYGRTACNWPGVGDGFLSLDINSYLVFNLQEGILENMNSWTS
jgi:hypothetical protein